MMSDIDNKEDFEVELEEELTNGEESVSGDTELDSGTGASDKTESEAEEEQTEEEKKPKRKPSRAERRIKELHAQLKATRTELEKQSQGWTSYLENLEASRQDTSTTDYTTRIAELEAKRKEAFDEADSDEWSRLDREIRKLEREELMATFSPKKDKPKPPEPFKFEEDTTPAEPSNAEVAWAKRNAWFNQPGKQPFTQAAMDIWMSLQDSYEVDDPALYSELDNQLYALYPQLKQVSSSGKKKSPVASGSRDTGRPAADKRKFTQADKEGMIKYSFGDPNDQEDRKKWLKFKHG